MSKAHLIVEGHGEVEAAGNLVTRLWPDAGGWQPWAPPRRAKNLHQEKGVRAAIERMAGKAIVGADGISRPGLREGSRYLGDWEARRGVKEWISNQFPPGRSYKPTLDQLPLTRMIDIDTLRAADVPCFGSLERALRFLAASFGRTGVYPTTLA